MADKAIRRLAAGALLALAALVVGPSALAATTPGGPADDDPSIGDRVGGVVGSGGILGGLIGGPAGAVVDKICPEVGAPSVEAPNAGLAGLFATRPPMPTTDVSDVEHLFSSGGFGGFSTAAYGKNCTALEERGDNNFANHATNFALMSTALADGIERRAWDVSWLTDGISRFTSAMVDSFGPLLWVGFVPLALVYVGLHVQLTKARDGDTAGAAHGAGWALLVVAIAAVLIGSPLLASTAGARISSTITTALYGNSDPATGVTDRVMRAVHYPAWQKKVFGSVDSPTAVEQGPVVLGSTRVTWAQMNASVEEKNAITAAKEAQFLSAATEVAKDETTYEYFTNQRVARAGGSVAEVVYAGSVNGFRIAAATLMLAGFVGLALLAVLWFAGSPYLLTPHGEEKGRGLLDQGARCVGFGLLGAVFSFAWIQWIVVCSTLPTGWGMVLALVGSVVAWGALSPAHKIANILTGGKVDANGRFLKKFMKYATKRAMMRRDVRTAVDGSAPGRKAEADIETAAEAANASMPVPPPLVMEGDVRTRDEQPRGPLVLGGRDGYVPPPQRNVVAGEVVVSRDEYVRPSAPAGAPGRDVVVSDVVPSAAPADSGPVYSRRGDS